MFIVSSSKEGRWDELSTSCVWCRIMRNDGLNLNSRLFQWTQNTTTRHNGKVFASLTMLNPVKKTVKKNFEFQHTEENFSPTFWWMILKISKENEINKRKFWIFHRGDLSSTVRSTWFLIPLSSLHYSTKKSSSRVFINSNSNTLEKDLTSLVSQHKVPFLSFFSLIIRIVINPFERWVESSRKRLQWMRMSREVKGRRIKDFFDIFSPFFLVFVVIQSRLSQVVLVNWWT